MSIVAVRRPGQGWEATEPGTVLYEIGGVPEAKAKVALNRIAHKMPFAVRMARRRPNL